MNLKSFAQLAGLQEIARKWLWWLREIPRYARNDGIDKGFKTLLGAAQREPEQFRVEEQNHGGYEPGDNSDES